MLLKWVLWESWSPGFRSEQSGAHILETSGSEVCDLVLRPVDGRAHLVAHLEEATGRLRAMRDEHEALRSLATRVHAPVLGRSDETPPLAVALSLSIELTEGHVNAAAIIGVLWGARRALSMVLSHFSEQESELELLGSRCNAVLTIDEMETLWTQTRRASESLSSRVPPSAARSLPDDVGEEY
jgi:hypothetical protein